MDVAFDGLSANEYRVPQVAPVAAALIYNLTQDLFLRPSGVYIKEVLHITIPGTSF